MRENYAELEIFCIFRVIFGRFVDIYALIYAKMFHGYDIMKHWLRLKCSRSAGVDRAFSR